MSNQSSPVSSQGRLVVYSARAYDRRFFQEAAHRLAFPLPLEFLEAHFNEATASLLRPGDLACIFVNDRADAPALARMAANGAAGLLLRSAGYNHVDLAAALRHGIRVARVPAYSPHAVAEHTLALILTLNRRIHRAFNRVREGNFQLDGLMGFDLHGKTVGVVGVGKIGALVARSLAALGCRVLAFDPAPEAVVAVELQALGVTFANRDVLLAESDVLTLHCPLTERTRHFIDAAAISRMKAGVMLVNTGRGGLVDTAAVLAGLKSGRIGNLALDVYEEEESLFFEDHSADVIQDDTLMRLMTFPNVLVTGHQAFFTREAVEAICETTLRNALALAGNDACPNEVR